jgi:hypothetical protein
MAEPDRPDHVLALAVGPAVRQHARHPADQGGVDRSIAVHRYLSCNAAHR